MSFSMSKKLLMNNFASDSGLMPVQDGLICWLDGRDGKTGDVIWKDRSGLQNNGDLTNVDFFNGNAIFKGDSSWVDFKKSTFKELDSVTVEITLELQEIGLFTLFDGKNGDIAYNSLGLWYGNIKNNFQYHPKGVAGNTNATKFEYTSNEKITVCGAIDRNKNRLYSNGILMDERVGTSNEIIVSPDAHLGARNNRSFGLVGTIQSFRIYNRVLTEEEIKHNYEYEKSIQRG